MRIEEFDYELPLEAIAQEPLPERDASRLLVLDRGTGAVCHHVFRDLPSLLSPGDLLIVNRSRVLPARLIGQRPCGGVAEILLVERIAGGEWEALVRPGRRLKAGTRVRISDELSVRILSAAQGPEARRWVRLEAADADAALVRSGHMPLPPYIRRPDRPADRERYQTLYAREPGSVAAPTAGLHFSEALLAALAARGIGRAELVLHVGPGTFRPVKVADVSEHIVEAEPYEIPSETRDAISATRARGGRIVAVGTTTLRALETAYDGGGVASGPGRTDLVVVPGFRFRLVDALITNFHLPRSSLLLLVSAFAGRDHVLAAYAEAIRTGYRFYSYGDAMLLK